MKQRPLTAKQVMFCEEYLIDLNALQAALRAGYSPHTAGVTGCENLKKPRIAAFIADALAKRTEKVQYTAQNLLEDMLHVLNIARDSAEEGGSANISAFKGLADSVGKHIGVQAFSEKTELVHSGAVTHETPTIEKDLLTALFERKREERSNTKVH